MSAEGWLAALSALTLAGLALWGVMLVRDTKQSWLGVLLELRRRDARRRGGR